MSDHNFNGLKFENKSNYKIHSFNKPSMSIS